MTGMTGMTGMTAVRAAFGTFGLGAGTYGLVLLIKTGLGNVADALPWLVGGVIAHDALLAPATIVVVVISTRLLPASLRGPAAVGMIVLSSLTLLAIPVLGRFGARPDNPTLLDRDYTAGWLVVAAITAAGVVVGAVLRRRGTHRTAVGDELPGGGR
jgi:hypothetical protein